MATIDDAAHRRANGKEERCRSTSSHPVHEERKLQINSCFDEKLHTIRNDGGSESFRRIITQTLNETAGQEGVIADWVYTAETGREEYGESHVGDWTLSQDEG